MTGFFAVVASLLGLFRIQFSSLGLVLFSWGFQTFHIEFSYKVCDNLYKRAVSQVGLSYWCLQLWWQFGLFERFNDCVNRLSKRVFCKNLEFNKKLGQILVIWMTTRFWNLSFAVAIDWALPYLLRKTNTICPRFHLVLCWCFWFSSLHISWRLSKINFLCRLASPDCSSCS